MSRAFAYLRSAGVSDTGLKRKSNEDSLLLLPECGLFCVADGMGGTRGGAVASKAVVDSLEQTFRAAPEAPHAVTALAGSRLATRALNQASSWIRERAEEMGLSGTGSTVVVMLFDRVTPAEAVLLHAGDSRAYRFRGNRLEQLTRDHSVAEAAGVDDEDKLPAMFRGVITRAVGLEHMVELEETAVSIGRGDVYLICSDGLSKMVSDRNITRIMKKSLGGGLDEAAQQLIDAALKAGGSDNVSVVLVEVADELPPAPTMEVGAETRELEAMVVARPEEVGGVEEGDEAVTGQTADTESLPKVGFTPQTGASDLTPPQPYSGDGETPTALKGTVTAVNPGAGGGGRRSGVWVVVVLLLLVGAALAVYYFYKHGLA